MHALPLQQEPALSQPPQTEIAVALVGRAHIRQQRVAGQYGTNHGSPSSFRTIATPFTMLANFCRAAQRAVWLSPQSGAKESAPRARASGTGAPGQQHPWASRCSSFSRR